MSCTFILNQKIFFFALIFKKVYNLLNLFLKNCLYSRKHADFQFSARLTFGVQFTLYIYYISNAISRAGAFATIALEEIISTPVEAIALTVERFTLPLASTIAE